MFQLQVVCSSQSQEEINVGLTGQLNSDNQKYTNYDLYVSKYQTLHGIIF